MHIYNTSNFDIYSMINIFRFAKILIWSFKGTKVIHKPPYSYLSYVSVLLIMFNHFSFCTLVIWLITINVPYIYSYF